MSPTPASPGRDPEQEPVNTKKIAVGAAIVILMAIIYGVLWRTGAIASIFSGKGLQEQVAQFGILGPLAIIGLIAFAIVFSPLPSAPIALAAGAAYGHFWGTAYIVIGAEIGALAAFTIARLLGHEVLRKWFGDRLSLGLLGSQNILMGIVFVSRMLPFISFDLVSYAAGLTLLSTWRFAAATVAGIIPASFLLAHFGDEIASTNPRRIVISVLALGIITAIPVLIGLIKARRAKDVKTSAPP